MSTNTKTMPKVSGLQLSKRYMDKLERFRDVALVEGVQVKRDKRDTLRYLVQGVINLGLVNEKNLKEIIKSGQSGPGDTDATD